MIIKKVYKKNYDGQKSVTIPQKSKIEAGDYVQIIKMKKIKPETNEEFKEDNEN